MLERVLVKYKQCESENKQLKTLATQLKEELDSRIAGTVVDKLL